VRYSTQIRPISYLKDNAAEVLQVLEEQRHWPGLAGGGPVPGIDPFRPAMNGRFGPVPYHPSVKCTYLMIGGPPCSGNMFLWR
jgi:hypothetical protein